MRRRPALFLFLSAFLGSTTGSLIQAADVLFWCALICAGIALVPRAWLRIGAFLSFTFFITAWCSAREKNHYDDVVQTLPVAVAHYSGTINEARKKADGSKLLEVHAQSVDNPSLAFNVQLILRGAVAALPTRAGQALEFRAKIVPFEKPLSPHYFDGMRFGLVKQLHGNAVITDADAIYLGAPSSLAYFAQLRDDIRTRFLKAVSPHEASMLLALIIGDTSLLDTNDKASFKAIGAEHLLAVSGLQINLLAWLCFFLIYPVIALMLPISIFHYARLITAVCATIILFWFLGLSGFSSSALRAFLMAVFLFLPTIWLRQIDSLDALCASGLLTLLWWPLAALDLGFLLSYAAVFGILFAHRARNSLGLPYARESLFFRAGINAVLYSLAAFLATLPIIAIAFGTIAPFAVIANALLTPVLMVTQIPAIVGGIVGYFFESSLVIEIAAHFANVIEILAKSLADLGGGVLIVPYWSPYALFLLALALNCAFFSVLRKSVPLLIASVLCFLWPGFELIDKNDLEITVIPVGQGDATLFSFDNGQHMLIDAGGAVFSSKDPGAEHVLPTLRRKGVVELDVLVISHPDPDHIMGAFAILEAMPVKEIWHSGFKPDHPLTKRLIAQAQGHAIRVKTTKDLLGSHKFGSSEVQILAPIGEDYYAELPANDNSLVMRFVVGAHALLWPGDLEYFGESLLVEGGMNLSATILKAPHHGSNTSSTERFLNAVNPKHVIFSTGTNNRFHFPHDEIVARYVRRGAQTWNTAVDGEITISINLQKITVQGYQRSFNLKPEHYHERQKT